MQILSFVIVTTNDLPEAYFLARHLAQKGQRVAMLNITRRTVEQKLRILARIGRKRSWLYLADLFLGRALRGFYLDRETVPFPDIDANFIAAAKTRLNYHATCNPHGPEALAFVRTCEPDYVLIAGAPVLKETLYRIGIQGALNRHLGLSPEYRGSDCPIWTLSQKDFDKVGFTIHEVSDRVDGGQILSQKAIAIDISLNLSQYMAKLQKLASEEFTAILDSLIAGGAITAHRQSTIGKQYPPAGLRAIHRAHANYIEYINKGRHFSEG